MSQSDLENEINKAVSKEIQRNVSVEIKPEIIPFHALPIYKESTSFVLNEEEKEVIVDDVGSGYVTAPTVTFETPPDYNENPFKDDPYRFIEEFEQVYE